MKEVLKIAAEYAVVQTNEVMSLAIAKAYSDGYRDGYKDREEEIPVDMRDNKTEFVDLGLPSGTLWAVDYERENGAIKYLPYDRVSTLSIPTEEQWKELFDTCRWNYRNQSGANKYFICIGPNGNCIRFSCYGSIQNGEFATDRDYALFWITDKGNEIQKSCVSMNYFQSMNILQRKLYKGYRLPIRLVRK